MSESIIDQADDTQDIGKTSDEANQDGDSTRRDQAKKALQKFNIYNAMLLISLVCITIAIYLMYVELTSFPGAYPWRTDEVLLQPLSNN